MGIHTFDDRNNAYFSAWSRIAASQEILYYYIDLCKTIDEHLDTALHTFDLNCKNLEAPDFQLEVINVCLEDCADEIIKWMSICYPTCCCAKRELLCGEGYGNLTKIVSDYYLNEATLAASLQQQANKNLARAVKVADSKITGLEFGIISNSMISHIVYLTQNEAKIRKQTKEAEEYLHQAKARISTQSNKQLKIGNRNYYTAIFAPQARQELQKAFWEMAMISLMQIERQCQVDISLVKQMDYEKSQELISRLDIANTPEDIIAKALVYYPYNVHIFVEAKRRNLYEFFLEQIVEMFSVEGIMQLDKAVDKEIGFSMVDGYGIETEIGNTIKNNIITLNDTEWKRLATEYLVKSKELRDNFPESFAPHGAIAIYLVASHMNSDDTSFWPEVSVSLRKFIELYSVKESPVDCFESIISAFRQYVDTYTRQSCVFSLDERFEFEALSERQRWQKTAITKRRMLPAIDVYAQFIEMLKAYNIKNVNTDILYNDLLWITYAFGIYHSFVKESPSGNGYIVCPYHIPLNERVPIIAIYDELVKSGAKNTENGLYANRKKAGFSFDKEIDRNEISIDGLRFFGLVENKPKAQKNTNTASHGCYIATCIYGSYDCPAVWTLRRYRDNILAAYSIGRMFIRIYYAISPSFVRLFGSTNWFRKFWKITLDRIVKILNIRGIDSAPYEDVDWR